MSESKKRHFSEEDKNNSVEGSHVIKQAKISRETDCESAKSSEGNDLNCTPRTHEKNEEISNGTTRRKLNQFGDYDDVTNMTVDDWEVRWGKGQTKFHMTQVHPILIKYVDTLLDGKDKQRIFLPLCGKSMDLKWLADKGHTVVGCDCVPAACQQFFEENEMEYVTEPVPDIDGTVYKAKDGPHIEIYCCDFFKLTSDVTGRFDCIWDRGSLVALGVNRRQEYADVISPLLEDGGRYLLECFLVDNEAFGGPPFNCTEGEVKSYFGDALKVEKLEKKDIFSPWQKSWGTSYFFSEIYLLTH